MDRLPNSLSTLKSLAVSSGTLVQKNALEYADTVSHSTLNVTLAPVASDPNAVVTVASAAAASAAVAHGSASAPIPLAVGDNRIECLVTAQDGTTQSLYTVQVTRLALLTRNRMLGSAISVLDSVEIPLGRPYQQSAPAVTGFHFVKWSAVAGSVAFGDTNAAATSVTLSLGDARIQAAYDTNTYTLAVTATNGSVARNPNQAAYNHGKSVVLTVTPVSGFQFSSWSDGNTANPRTVSMVSNTVLSAACTAISIYTLTLAGSPAGFRKHNGKSRRPLSLQRDRREPDAQSRRGPPLRELERRPDGKRRSRRLHHDRGQKHHGPFRAGPLHLDLDRSR